MGAEAFECDVEVSVVQLVDVVAPVDFKPVNWGPSFAMIATAHGDLEEYRVGPSRVGSQGAGVPGVLGDMVDQGGKAAAAPVVQFWPDVPARGRQYYAEVLVVPREKRSRRGTRPSQGSG